MAAQKRPHSADAARWGMRVQLDMTIYRLAGRDQASDEAHRRQDVRRRARSCDRASSPAQPMIADDLKRRMHELRERLRTNPPQRPQLTAPDPPPVYDDVFVAGTVWLDEHG